MGEFLMVISQIALIAGYLCLISSIILAIITIRLFNLYKEKNATRKALRLNAEPNR
jgi:hypothetical protein